MNDLTPDSVSPVPPAPPAPVVEGPRRSSFGRLLMMMGVMAIVGSILLNLVLIMVVGIQVGGAEGRTAQRTLTEGDPEQTVAIYKLNSIIAPEAVKAFENFQEDVIDDDDVKAVVLRIVSPGGSVSSSDQIRRMVVELKEAGKIVVVSMGDVAASGGYYIAAPADEILAERTTITGSIGVIMSYVLLEGTMDKLGMEPVVIKSTHASAWKDAGSPFRRLSPRERQYLLDILNAYQGQFEQVVRDGRGERLHPREVTVRDTIGEGDDAEVVEIKETEPFNGKIYLPEEAKALGLIDGIGYQSDAVDRAAELAELEDPNVVLYGRRPSMIETLFGAKAPTIETLGPEMLNDLKTPKFEMIWRVE